MGEPWISARVYIGGGVWSPAGGDWEGELLLERNKVAVALPLSDAVVRFVGELAARRSRGSADPASLVPLGSQRSVAGGCLFWGFCPLALVSSLRRLLQRRGGADEVVCGRLGSVQDRAGCAVPVLARKELSGSWCYGSWLALQPLLHRRWIRPWSPFLSSLSGGNGGISCGARDVFPTDVLEPDPSFRPEGRALMRCTKPMLAMAMQVRFSSAAAREMRKDSMADTRPSWKMVHCASIDPGGRLCIFFFLGLFVQLCWDSCPGWFWR